MSRVSGWCSGPNGARLKCEGCRSEVCEHFCHENERETEKESD